MSWTCWAACRRSHGTSEGRQVSRAERDRAGIDLLVTDHLMPGMTGTELARLVRSRQPATRTLVISGYADVDGVAPDLPRLTKPFRKDDLSAKLNELAET